MPQSPTIVILGGRSLVAPYLIKRLAEAGLKADVISRGEVDLPNGFNSISLSLGQSATWNASEKSIVISLLPLSVLSLNLGHFTKAQSIIALGSTSRFSKAKSEDPYERTIAENLEMAENILKPWCLKNKIVFTLLRPTLIYDGAKDQNIARIAGIIRRFGFFPIAAPGNGLRQPIHADDVAKAIFNALGNASVYNKALNIAGGEVLPYRRMVENIFLALGRKPRVLTIPACVLQSGFKAASKFGVLKEKAFGFEIFKRMNEDLVFDNDEGLALLDYRPRGFKLEMKAM